MNNFDREPKTLEPMKHDELEISSDTRSIDAFLLENGYTPMTKDEMIQLDSSAKTLELKKIWLNQRIKLEKLKNADDDINAKIDAMSIFNDIKDPLAMTVEDIGKTLNYDELDKLTEKHKENANRIYEEVKIKVCKEFIKNRGKKRKDGSDDDMITAKELPIIEQLVSAELKARQINKIDMSENEKLSVAPVIINGMNLEKKYAYEAYKESICNDKGIDPDSFDEWYARVMEDNSNYITSVGLNSKRDAYGGNLERIKVSMKKHNTLFKRAKNWEKPGDIAYKSEFVQEYDRIETEKAKRGELTSNSKSKELYNAMNTGIFRPLDNPVKLTEKKVEVLDRHAIKNKSKNSLKNIEEKVNVDILPNNIVPVPEPNQGKSFEEMMAAASVIAIGTDKEGGEISVDDKIFGIVTENIENKEEVKVVEPVTEPINDVPAQGPTLPRKPLKSSAINPNDKIEEIDTKTNEEKNTVIDMILDAVYENYLKNDKDDNKMVLLGATRDEIHEFYEDLNNMRTPRIEPKLKTRLKEVVYAINLFESDKTKEYFKFMYSNSTVQEFKNIVTEWIRNSNALQRIEDKLSNDYKENYKYDIIFNELVNEVQKENNIVETLERMISNKFIESKKEVIMDMIENNNDKEKIKKFMKNILIENEFRFIAPRPEPDTSNVIEYKNELETAADSVLENRIKAFASTMAPENKPKKYTEMSDTDIPEILQKEYTNVTKLTMTTFSIIKDLIIEERPELKPLEYHDGKLTTSILEAIETLDLLPGSLQIVFINAIYNNELNEVIYKWIDDQDIIRRILHHFDNYTVEKDTNVQDILKAVEDMKEEDIYKNIESYEDEKEKGIEGIQFDTVSAVVNGSKKPVIAPVDINYSKDRFELEMPFNQIMKPMEVKGGIDTIKNIDSPIARLKKFTKEQKRGMLLYLPNSNYEIFVKKIKNRDSISYLVSLLNETKDINAVEAYIKYEVLRIAYENIDFMFETEVTMDDFMHCVHESDMTLIMMALALVNLPEDEDGKVLININALLCNDSRCNRVIQLKEGMKIDLKNEFAAIYPIAVFKSEYPKYKAANYTDIYKAYWASSVGKMQLYTVEDKENNIKYDLVLSAPTVYKTYAIKNNIDLVGYSLALENIENKKNIMSEINGIDYDSVADYFRTHSFKQFKMEINEYQNISYDDLSAEQQKHSEILAAVIEEIELSKQANTPFTIIADLIDNVKVTVLDTGEIISKGINQSLPVDLIEFIALAPEAVTEILVKVKGDTLEKSLPIDIIFEPNELIGKFSFDNQYGTEQDEINAIKEKFPKLKPEDLEALIKRNLANRAKMKDELEKEGKCLCGNHVWKLNYTAILFFWTSNLLEAAVK